MKHKNHPLVLFFIAAFTLPWLVWGTTIAQEHGVINWHIPQSLAFWIGLTLATYGVAALTGGKKAVLDLLKRLIRVKVHPGWYAAAILTVPAIAGMAIGLYMLFGGPAPRIGETMSAGSLLAYLPIGFWLFLITEETAWRGFALPRLQKKYGPITASLVLGLLWGLWHIPLFFISDSFQASLPFIGFVMSAVALSVTTTWIFNNTRGSVFVAAILHAITDGAIAYLGVMSGDRLLFWLFVALQILVAIALLRTKAFRKIGPEDHELVY